MDAIFQKELIIRLQGIPPEKVVFVGVGNRMRGDDAIGPVLIDMLSGEVPHAIDADGAPENVTAAIRRLKPLAIVFLDAASLGEAPGSARVVEAGELEKLEASVHNFSLDVVMEYLKASTGADVFLVGVQPERVGEGEGISPALERPLKEIAIILKSSIKKD
ncbi:MAG TPA: hydrogenase maturation protease [Methanocella sp.]|uniref:hydrogenase maturation protease n=1 Tax=Methanocella sp. TaxID=2052833 RepID=UPI002CDC9299|nr:hydrogenase maturation protease [Methanocella sp.]HTY91633.1 hydrogenase maturation protease [Methanocella sp.]